VQEVFRNILSVQKRNAKAILLRIPIQSAPGLRTFTAWQAPQFASLRAIRTAIHESIVFPRKLFERRSGTGILPMRFNQADIFEN
jgi:hypothetical protein